MTEMEKKWKSDIENIWTVQENLLILGLCRVHRKNFVLPTSFNSDPILWTQVRENMEHGVLI